MSLLGEENHIKKMIEIMRKFKNDNDTVFVAPSKFYANQYRNLTSCNIKFIPHAIDVKRIKTQISKINIIEDYNLAKDKIRIIVTSKLEPKQKQPRLLLDACCLLKEKKKKKIEIIYTGLDKQYEQFVEELIEQARENNIDIKIIRFDDMAEVYKIANLTVLPSKSESFGYSALESLSLGIFTILNDIPTFNEIVEDNDNNYIFKNNIVELKEKIEQIIRNTKILDRKVPNKKWQKQYSLIEFKNAYIDLIK